MTLSRRKFLKLTLAGFATVAVPKIAESASKLTEITGPKRQAVRHSQILRARADIDGGDYILSAHVKKNAGDEWFRVSKRLTLEKSEWVEVSFDDVEIGYIKYLQLELDVCRSGGYVRNYVQSAYLDDGHNPQELGEAFSNLSGDSDFNMVMDVSSIYETERTNLVNYSNEFDDSRILNNVTVDEEGNIFK